MRGFVGFALSGVGVFVVLRYRLGTSSWVLLWSFFLCRFSIWSWYLGSQRAEARLLRMLHLQYLVRCKRMDGLRLCWRKEFVFSMHATHQRPTSMLGKGVEIIATARQPRNSVSYLHHRPLIALTHEPACLYGIWSE
ncbi:hypothetical protein BDR22DRAFT_654071 [Usnea florida]